MIYCVVFHASCYKTKNYLPLLTRGCYFGRIVLLLFFLLFHWCSFFFSLYKEEQQCNNNVAREIFTAASFYFALLIIGPFIVFTSPIGQSEGFDLAPL